MECSDCFGLEPKRIPQKIEFTERDWRCEGQGQAIGREVVLDHHRGNEGDAETGGNHLGKRR